MKKSALTLSTFAFALLAAPSHASLLQDSKYYEYDVRFTNPVCAQYDYAEPVQAVDGSWLESKPKDVYCKAADGKASGDRDSSVQTKLIEWIRSPKTKEIFFTYLSFSNDVIGDELCRAIERGVKVRFVLDSGTDLKRANKLLACEPESGEEADRPELFLRGNQKGLGYAHNKLMVFNPNSQGQVRLVFSSGNMSSGVVVHHENWHFVSAAADTYFMQSHLCLMNGMIDHGDSAKDYRAYIESCRAEIEAEPETDIQSFFVPGRGEGEAATQAIRDYILGRKKTRDLPAIPRAKRVSIAAHRFSYTSLIGFLDEALASGKTEVELVTDDDTYWVGTTGVAVGANPRAEYFKIMKLVEQGMGVRWLETNHGSKLLHHNKFLIFDDRAVFAGAGNLTGDAFAKNFENFYLITIPEVVEKFRAQYERLYGEMATPTERMPVEDIAP